MLRAAVTSQPFRSIRQASGLLRRREISCEAMVRECLARIEKEQPRLNAFITVLGERAMGEAKARDAELAAGRDRGPLHGIPIVHKDVFDTAGVLTTGGSKLFENRVPAVGATTVQRLEQAGAVVLGKTNLNELAAGTSGRNVHYGDVRNPLNVEYSAGGSSAGTAAAIAAGLCLAGTGSDTGGSIRIPAACNGLVGLRPTFGRVPLDGVIPRSRSLDTVGPLAHTVDDCALLFSAMAAVAPVHVSAPRSLRVAVFDDLPQLDADVAKSIDGALHRPGLVMRKVQLSEIFSDETLETIMDIMLYEFHDLFREDYRAQKEPAKVFGPVVLANLERGSRIGVQRYTDCLRRVELLSRKLRDIAKDVDAIALPVLVEPTPLLESPPSVYDAQRRLTLPIGATGLPSISVPCGKDRRGLPLGLQLVGTENGEEELFNVAAAFEQ